MLRNKLLIVYMIALTACGGGGKSALINACVEQGDTKKDCACMAEKLEEGLSPAAFDAMVLGAKGNEEAAEAAMKELGIGEAMKIGAVMLTVFASCGVTSFN